MIEPREPICHDVKCWPPFFAAVKDGRKPFEVRLNDRDYRVGDMLLLREWQPIKASYTGDTCECEITYIFPKMEIGAGCPANVLPRDWVVLGLKREKRDA